MRIGIECTPMLGNRSGVGHYTEQIVTHLAQARPTWEFTLFCNRPLEQFVSPGVTLAEGYFPRSRWLWMQLKLPGAIRQERPDLCHFPNNSAPIRHVTPYVTTIHDASLFLYRRHHPWSRLLALRLLMPLVARRASAVITDSESARADLVRVLGLPPDKVHAIHLAVADSFHPWQQAKERENLQEKYGLPPQFILYVGSIEPRKNLRRLVQAVSGLHRRGLRAHLCLVGPNGRLLDVLQKEAAQLGLAGFVHYLGYVHQADLPGLYSLATVFAFPSLYEGFGLPPLEAMACGAPVLSSRGTAMEEVCGEAAWLVDPRDVAEMSAGLHTLLTDGRQRDVLREKGWARVQQFTWAQTAEKTAVLYEKVMG
ncbi:MAG: glycosyltransferase family 4 protein [Anaerolineae bacterium]|nr:glycosyltransferase family 4 protein [Anaerolineae bacterium]